MHTKPKIIKNKKTGKYTYQLRCYDKYKGKTVYKHWEPAPELAGKSRKEIERACEAANHKFTEKYLRGYHREKSEYTLPEYIDRYINLKDINDLSKQSTLSWYGYQKKRIEDYFGNKPISEITSYNIENFFTEIRYDRKNRTLRSGPT